MALEICAHITRDGKRFAHCPTRPFKPASSRDGLASSAKVGRFGGKNYRNDMVLVRMKFASSPKAQVVIIDKSVNINRMMKIARNGPTRAGVLRPTGSRRRY